VVVVMLVEVTVKVCGVYWWRRIVSVPLTYGNDPLRATPSHWYRFFPSITSSVDDLTTNGPAVDYTYSCATTA
jgi:hypothetical protein